MKMVMAKRAITSKRGILSSRPTKKATTYDRLSDLHDVAMPSATVVDGAKAYILSLGDVGFSNRAALVHAGLMMGQLDAWERQFNATGEKPDNALAPDGWQEVGAALLAISPYHQIRTGTFLYHSPNAQGAYPDLPRVPIEIIKISEAVTAGYPLPEPFPLDWQLTDDYFVGHLKTIAGPKGEDGETGETGATGAKGADGKDGKDGSSGGGNNGNNGNNPGGHLVPAGKSVPGSTQQRVTIPEADCLKIIMVGPHGDGCEWTDADFSERLNAVMATAPGFDPFIDVLTGITLHLTATAYLTFGGLTIPVNIPYIKQDRQASAVGSDGVRQYFGYEDTSVTANIAPDPSGGPN